MPAWSAAAIGLIAGALICLATFGLEQLKIDDPVGAVPVHLVNGAWGVLAVGIFAAGNPDTAGWNGVSTAVTGLLGGSGAQLLPQILEVVVVGLWAFGLSYAFFTVLRQAGVLRSRIEDEVAGLDLPELGELGYAADAPVTGGRDEPVSAPIFAAASPTGMGQPNKK